MGMSDRNRVSSAELGLIELQGQRFPPEKIAAFKNKAVLGKLVR
jgi:hypothetical protein